MSRSILSSKICFVTNFFSVTTNSCLFRRPEGCFLNINDQDAIEECLSNFGRGEDIDYIVVSDGEEVPGPFHSHCYLMHDSDRVNYRFSELATKVLVRF